MQLPLINVNHIFHIGTLNPDHRGERSESQEGHLISVSNCPYAWRNIAKLGGSELHQFSKDDGIILLDMNAVSHLKNEIKQWAIDHQLTETKTMFKAWAYDSDSEAWWYTLQDSHASALIETDEDDKEGPHGSGCIEAVEVMIGTEKLGGLVKIKNMEKEDAFDFLVMIWAQENHPKIDGVWWNETYDPDSLSAPRGGIFPDRLERIQKTKVDWSQAPDEDSEEFNPIIASNTTLENQSSLRDKYQKQTN